MRRILLTLTLLVSWLGVFAQVSSRTISLPPAADDTQVSGEDNISEDTYHEEPFGKCPKS